MACADVAGGGDDSAQQQQEPRRSYRLFPLMTRSSASRLRFRFSLSFSLCLARDWREEEEVKKREGEEKVREAIEQ